MKVLLIDRFPEEMLAQLRALDAEIRYLPEAQREEVIAQLPDTDVLLMNSKVKVDADLLAHAPKLGLLCRAGVGLDHFDLPLLESKGVQVVNTPGANADSVAEQTVGMMLGLLHRIAAADREVRQFQWRREANRGTELGDQTVGIIGYGHTGSRVARRLSGFGCRVIAYDKYKAVDDGHAAEVGLDELLQSVDVLSLHVPLTDETEGWLDVDFYARLAKPIWLLNLSRGPIVPLAPLNAALDSGQVVAAGLDVLENEKLSRLSEAQEREFRRLIARDNVLLTPHIGGWSHQSLRHINNRLVEAVKAYLDAQR